MAERAAEDFSSTAASLLGALPVIDVVFSGAQSQGAFHAALRVRQDIAWDRINAFAVDEFYSPGMPAGNAVSAQPRRDLYRHVALRSVNVIDYAAFDPEAERARYEALITKHPPHISCLGIGISGHLALNEPGAADFEDPQKVRLVRVCDESKRQLENDPNFKDLPAIPDQGITITLPVLMAASAILVVVPYALKAPIIARLMTAPVTNALPATILKLQKHARMYLDHESSRG